MVITKEQWKPETWTAIPNVFCDVLMPLLTPPEVVAALYLFRKLRGFHRPSFNAISLGQMLTGQVKRTGERQDGGTGLSEGVLLKALRTLIDVGVVERRSKPGCVSLYRLTERPEEIDLEWLAERKGLADEANQRRTSAARAKRQPATSDKATLSDVAGSTPTMPDMATPAMSNEVAPAMSDTEDQRKKERNGDTYNSREAFNLWAVIRDALSLQLAKTNYRAFVAPSEAMSLRDGVLIVASPDPVWSEHRLALILARIVGEMGEGVVVKFVPKTLLSAAGVR